MASRQASNQGKIQSRAPESWSCASSAPSISSLPQLPAFPHHVSHLHRAEAEPRGLGFFGFYPFLQSALMVGKAAPGSGLGQRLKRLLARPVEHAAAQPLPRASMLTEAAVLLLALSLVKTSWLNVTGLTHPGETPTVFSWIWA